MAKAPRGAGVPFNQRDMVQPTLIGISRPGTRETVRFGLHAKAHGADGVVAINPYYAALSEANIYR